MSITTERPPEADWRNATFRVTTRLALPFLLPLMDGEYVVTLPNGNSARVFLNAVDRVLGEQTPDSAIEIAHEFPAGRLKGAKGFDIPGHMVNFTAVGIYCEVVQDHDLSDEDLLLLEASAYQVLRHFLDIYRHLNADASIRLLSPPEFYETRGDQPLVVSVRAVVAGIEVRDSHLPRYATQPVQTPRPILEPAFHERFRSALASAETPPLGPLLLLNGRAALERGDTRTAILDMHSALDVVVEQKAVRVLIASGSTMDEAHSRVSALPSRRIVQKILHQGLAIDVLQTAEWKAWDNDFRDLRNQVVHDGLLPGLHVTRRCLKAVTELGQVILDAPVRGE